MPFVFVMTNHEGGVGKSTTAFEYDPHCSASRAYAQFAADVLSQMS
jgi:hypothetical protein